MSRSRIHIFQSFEAFEAKRTPTEFFFGKSDTVLITVDSGQIVSFPDTAFGRTGLRVSLVSLNGVDLEVSLLGGTEVVSVTLLRFVDLLEDPNPAEIRFNDAVNIASIDALEAKGALVLVAAGGPETFGEVGLRDGDGAAHFADDDGLGNDGSIPPLGFDVAHIVAMRIPDLTPSLDQLSLPPLPLVDVPNPQPSPLPDVQVVGIPNPDPLPDVPELPEDPEAESMLVAAAASGGAEKLTLDVVLADFATPVVAILFEDGPSAPTALEVGGAYVEALQTDIIDRLFDADGLGLT